MIDPGQNCTGCMACYHICPVHAIKIDTDINGFYIPKVDGTRCTHCEKCLSLCPQKVRQEEKKTKRAVWLQHGDPSVLERSSSGGAMYMLSQYVLKQGGIVFGCAFDAATKTFICTNTDKVPLEKLMRSKYVESYVGNAFEEVKQALLQGRWVLFCGTPCQVSGLKNYVGKEEQKLILVDFPCGGVPSQEILKRYLEILERKYRSPIVDINFRDKYFIWGQYGISMSFENGKTYRCIAEADPYFWAFLYSKASKRSSCLNCSHQKVHCADFVIADFWKYRDFKMVPEDKRKGLSLCLCQTEKSLTILEQCSEGIYMGDVDIQKASYNFYNREVGPKVYEQALKDREYIREKGIHSFYRKAVPLSRRMKYCIKNIVYVSRCNQ